MATTDEALRQAKDVFKQSGINQDVAVAGQISWLLCVNKKNFSAWDSLKNSANKNDLPNLLDKYHVELHGNNAVVLPQPERLDQTNLAKVIDNLKAALQDCNNNAGKLFQRYLRYELLKSTTGGQYPTPVHIADFMANLLDINSENEYKLADFTCGTGGLPIAILEKSDNQKLHITAYDYDPTWAALAWANFYLHDVTYFNLEVKSAFNLTPSANFDLVIMNPPFGSAKINANSSLMDYGSRGETVLTALALNSLKENGRGAVLVSRSVLFIDSGGEKKLRQELQPYIESVIELPKDALQPHSNTGAHVLLFKKPAKNHIDTDATQNNAAKANSDIVWFFRATYDGYPSGSSRDWSKDQKGQDPNDLPLIQTALKTVLPINSVANNTSDLQVTKFDDFYLVDYHQSGKRTLKISQEGGFKVETVADKLEKEGQQQAGVIKLAESEHTRYLVFDRKGTLFGVAIERTALGENSWEPKTYLTETKDETVSSPPLIMANIRRNQHRLNSKVDRLLAKVAKKTASKVNADNNWLISSLSKAQKEVWQAFESAANNETTQSDADDKTEIIDADTIERTLELFEKAGLLIKVNKPPQAGQNETENSPFTKYKKVTM